MRRVDGGPSELSFVPLHGGQPLIDEMLGMIYQIGFQMVGVKPVFWAEERNTCSKSVERSSERANLGLALRAQVIV